MAGVCHQQEMAEEIDLYEDIFLPVDLGANQDTEVYLTRYSIVAMQSPFLLG